MIGLQCEMKQNHSILIRAGEFALACAARYEEWELFQLVQINVHKFCVMFIERLSEGKQTRK